MDPTPHVYLLDIIMPGYRRIEHKLVFGPSPLFETMTLVAYPTRGFGVHLDVQPGQAFEFSGKYGTRLYLTAKGEVLPERLDEAWKAAHVSAPPPVEHIGVVSMTSPIESILTRVRIERADATSLVLAVVEEEREHFYPAFLAWLIPVLLVALGVWGLVKIRRARLAKSQPA